MLHSLSVLSEKQAQKFRDVDATKKIYQTGRQIQLTMKKLSHMVREIGEKDEEIELLANEEIPIEVSDHMPVYA